MKKTALLSLILATMAAETYAQNTVNFTINGKITTRTCSVTGGTDKTITMADKDVSQFAAANAEVYGDASDSATISCPATQRIDISYTDKAAGATTGQPFLRNTATGTGTNAPAGGVGVKVYFRNNNQNTSTNNGVGTMNTGVTRTFRNAQGTDFQTLNNYQIHVHPHYFRHSTAAVTPGVVKAEMTLNITYP